MSATQVAFTIGAGVGIYALYRFWCQRKKEENWVRVGMVSELFIYPVKSCKGRAVQSAECLELGLKHEQYFDRRFVIVDENDAFVTARERPKIVLIDTRCENDSLTLLAPGMPSVTIDLSNVFSESKISRIRRGKGPAIDAYDCGSDVSKWLTDFISDTDSPAAYYRLFHFRPGLFNDRSLQSHVKYKGFSKRNDPTVFADLSSYVLMTETSLQDMNTRVPDAEEFHIRNFRPNIVVSGTRAYEEDNWAKVRIGEDATFSNVKGCTRCLFTTVNWATGQKHPNSEPLKTLRSYRKAQTPWEKKFYGDSPVMGINLGADKNGVIAVGDPVYVVYK